MPNRNSNDKNKKRTSKRRIITYTISIFALLCVAAVATLFILYKDVKVKVFMELGDQLPSAEVFAKSDSVRMEYITELSQIELSETGDHWIHVSANSSDRLVDLAVRDTVAPAAQPVDISISINDTLTPDQLISSIEDAGQVKVGWDEPPEFGTAGDYTVLINLEDMEGNSASVTSALHIRAVVETVNYEVGAALPTVQDFLFDASLQGNLITDLDTLPLETPGEYDVSIAVNDVTYTSRLIVTDTINPELSLRKVYARPGEPVEPEDFVSSATDASALSFTFSSEPKYDEMGFQEIGVVATDLGGNSVEVKSTLLISKVAPITVEIRDTELTALDFAEAAGSVAITQTFIPDKLGEYDVDLTLDDEYNPTRVTVVDTTPPQAEAVDVDWYIGHPLSPERFVENAFDYTDITYTFDTEPDWNAQSPQGVSVILTDATGNHSTYNSTLTLEYDTEAPSLYGVKDRYCYIGQAVAYFAEVFAEDNCDAEIAVEVDNSNVDMNKAGTYEVAYSATDSSGNSVEKSCAFTFVEATVTDEELNAAADQVIAEIITDDMNIGQKAYAIFKYVNKHIRYNGIGNKTDWKYEAYNGITAGKGDCFTFYSTAKCLLERIGAQTIGVERHGGNKTTHHYWLLVNLGTGWYHFDAINVGPRNFDCFMKTDKELLARGRNWWSFDRSLYPPSPEESFVLED